MFESPSPGSEFQIKIRNERPDAINLARGPGERRVNGRCKRCESEEVRGWGGTVSRNDVQGKSEIGTGTEISSAIDRTVR